MSVLIVTEPDDLHAVLVKLALEEKNVVCDLFFSADMPSQQEHSLAINNKQLCWRSSFTEQKVNLASSCYSVIWWRRPRLPFIAKDSVHPEDNIFVNKENQVFFHAMPYFFSEESWWVNPIESANKIKLKPYQLKMAQQCGFNLPTTLISNSPSDIKQFIDEAGYKEVIYKSFAPQYWQNDRGFKNLYTQKIQLHELPSDKMIKILPGIYQHYVEKLYELRITCFGSYLSAIKIDSQKNDSSKLDWRNGTQGDLALQEIEIPPNLKQLIIVYMKKMNMVFGCFDFIVTPNEEYVFLEVNEQGQFLWVEERLPQTHYLDVFCNFLLSRRFDFNWTLHNKRIFIADYEQEAQSVVAENIQNHIYLNDLKRTA